MPVAQGTTLVTDHQPSSRQKAGGGSAIDLLSRMVPAASSAGAGAASSWCERGRRGWGIRTWRIDYTKPAPQSAHLGHDVATREQGPCRRHLSMRDSNPQHPGDIARLLYHLDILSLPRLMADQLPFSLHPRPTAGRLGDNYRRLPAVAVNGRPHPRSRRYRSVRRVWSRSIWRGREIEAQLTEEALPWSRPSTTQAAACGSWWAAMWLHEAYAMASRRPSPPRAHDFSRPGMRIARLGSPLQQRGPSTPWSSVDVLVVCFWWAWCCGVTCDAANLDAFRDRSSEVMAFFQRSV